MRKIEPPANTLWAYIDHLAYQSPITALIVCVQASLDFN